MVSKPFVIQVISSHNQSVLLRISFQKSLERLKWRSLSGCSGLGLPESEQGTGTEEEARRLGKAVRM